MVNLVHMRVLLLYLTQVGYVSTLTVVNLVHMQVLLLNLTQVGHASTVPKVDLVAGTAA